MKRQQTTRENQKAETEKWQVTYRNERRRRRAQRRAAGATHRRIPVSPRRYHMTNEASDELTTPIGKRFAEPEWRDAAAPSAAIRAPVSVFAHNDIVPSSTTSSNTRDINPLGAMRCDGRQFVRRALPTPKTGRREVKFSPSS